MALLEVFAISHGSISPHIYAGAHQQSTTLDRHTGATANHGQASSLPRSPAICCLSPELERSQRPHYAHSLAATSTCGRPTRQRHLHSHPASTTWHHSRCARQLVRSRCSASTVPQGELDTRVVVVQKGEGGGESGARARSRPNTCGMSSCSGLVHAGLLLLLSGRRRPLGRSLGSCRAGLTVS